ncbi:AIPR family protein [Pseudomonas aeruginosa]|uniref:AIPR family protein n=1 Tax=Pseudomonas aeruginosa TaxID=287 RepID=UPI001A221072|nr:AIPR family protein [Pseudomonas aeruginosa]MBG7441582.1 AIPR family protein [Pseudomonas aeruginosa]MDU0512594.1 AIPR family protein [Pseudomonas aeruginosa]HED8873736.1 AIPR family protein [Pseudomonas aeruginosa]
MELVDFLRETQDAIREELGKDIAPGKIPVSAEELFTEQVMNHMAEQGITFDTNVCHYEARVSTFKVKISGYSVSDTTDENGFPDRLDLFVSLYRGLDEIESLPDQEIGRAATQGLQFLKLCARNQLSKKLDETNNVFALATEVERIFGNLDSIRVFVITDAKVKTRDYAPQDVEGKQVRVEVMDIQRLFNHWQQGRPRDEVVVNFQDLCGSALPSVWVPGSDDEEYDYALTAVPGNVLRVLYEKYGPRILEANVRSFLGVSSKGVNKGIRDTLRDAPERFMAYNNGIVVVADAARLDRTKDGSLGILWLQGMQIVNGGQTTASLYFAKKKQPDINLENVRVPAKIIVLKSDNADAEELISNISRYANSQNVVKQSDLSANKPFHRELEKLSMRTFCPDGVGRWFYERSAGSYKVMLEKDAATTSQKKKLQSDIPSSRKLTKPDLAKFLFAWGQKPYLVSLGSQKNFQAFMDELAAREEAGENVAPNADQYREMVAKAIIFKSAHRIIRPLFAAFQANITAYTVSVLALQLGDRFSFEKVWQEQTISPQLQKQIAVWAHEVNAVLDEGANGRMISEWAKKPECWQKVRNHRYSANLPDIPEIA